MSRTRDRLRAYWRTSGRKDLRFYLIFFGTYFLLQATVVANVKVPSGSMRETIHEGDRFLVRKLGFGIKAPLDPRDKVRILGRPVLRWRDARRGDIIVFVPPAHTGMSKTFTKRVIGLPGEVVEVRAGLGVFIDGERLPEPYIKEPPGYSFPPALVPRGHVFVLGDSRNNSFDSHLWGPLPMRSIHGVLALRYWPPWRAAVF